jgi:class 3 adenylate cyclase
MGLMMWKWILMLACAVPWPGAFAADVKVPSLSLEDPHSLTWAAMDNPAGLRTWARQQVEALDPAKEGRLWVLAVAALFHKAEDYNVKHREILRKALKLAAQYSIPNEALFDLKDAEMQFKLLDASKSEDMPPEKRFERVQFQVELAERLQLPGRKAQAKLGWGVLFLDSGRDNEGVQKIHEALRELNKAQNVDDLDIMDAKGTYADALLNIQPKEKSQAIYRELEQFCQRLNPRMYCLVVYHAQAYLSMHEQTPSGFENALSSLHRSLAIAEELREDNTIASVSNSMVQLLDEMGRYQEAEGYAMRAIEIFQKTNNQIWLGDTRRKLSKVYIKLKQPDKALAMLTAARSNFPREYAWDHAQISFQQAQAYQLIQQYHEAYDALKIYARVVKQSASQNQSAEIAQSLTQINLELEEERSRSLTEAEQQQKAQAELEMANRLEQEQTLLLINGIGVTSGVLVLSGFCGFLWIRQQNKRILNLNRHLRENILHRFLPPLVAEKVASGQAVLDETPHEQAVTVLFGRLVGLEHAIEELGPRVTARLLESLMEAVTDVSLEHRGCLDKLHRGSFLILFGAPLPCSVEEQIKSSVAFARAIMERFEQIRVSWPQVEGWRPSLAIGIHHGSALVGVFGGRRRADYTAVGQAVNLAARIEGHAISNQILLSESVATLLGVEYSQPLGEVRLKGIAIPQKLFRLVNAQARRNAS